MTGRATTRGETTSRGTADQVRPHPFFYCFFFAHPSFSAHHHHHG
jgi:hypothetical protein